MRGSGAIWGEATSFAVGVPFARIITGTAFHLMLDALSIKCCYYCYAEICTAEKRITTNAHQEK
jgi:hypothetical protein